MSSPPPDPTAAVVARIDTELTAVRTSLEALGRRIDTLASENSSLHGRLEQSENARRDLVAQAEHLIELLAQARREVRTLTGQSPV